MYSSTDQPRSRVRPDSFAAPSTGEGSQQIVAASTGGTGSGSSGGTWKSHNANKRSRGGKGSHGKFKKAKNN